MITLFESKNGDVNYLGVVSTKEWFDGQKIPFPFDEFDYVVGEWSDFHDGVNSHIEGKLTYAICKLYDEAETLFEYRLNKLDTFKKIK